MYSVYFMIYFILFKETTYILKTHSCIIFIFLGSDDLPCTFICLIATHDSFIKDLFPLSFVLEQGAETLF